jgi:hypothetical protein
MRPALKRSQCTPRPPITNRDPPVNQRKNGNRSASTPRKHLHLPPSQIPPSQPNPAAAKNTPPPLTAQNSRTKRMGNKPRPRRRRLTITMMDRKLTMAQIPTLTEKNHIKKISLIRSD